MRILLYILLALSSCKAIDQRFGPLDAPIRYYDGCNWVIEYPNGSRGMTSLGCSNIDSLNVKIK